MRLLVVGGSGFLGGYVLREAIRHGHEVVALARSSAAARVVVGYGAQPLSGDLDDARCLDEAFAGASVTVRVSSRPPKRSASRGPSSSRLPR
jgi:uncharacterized protein YbjT (DUF2867 family)